MNIYKAPFWRHFCWNSIIHTASFQHVGLGGQMDWPDWSEFAWNHKSRSPAHTQKLSSPSLFFFLFFLMKFFKFLLKRKGGKKEKAEKENQDRASMGLPVPVHPQFPYPISLVSVTHGEHKYAALSSVEKWWEMKKKFVPMGDARENISGKHFYFSICKGFPDTACQNPALQSGLQTLRS